MNEITAVKKKYIEYVDKLVTNNKVSHAYLVEVDNYDSDMKYIYDFIKMILCNCSYQGMLLSDNKIISLIDNNNYPDIKQIEPDGNWIKKTQLLDLQKEYSNKSLLGGKRIYIIKAAEKLNSSSANTILKFLEEPEDDIVAFLVTDNRYHVLDTILSRCQILNLKDSLGCFEVDEDIIDLLDCIMDPNTFFIKYNFLINDFASNKNIFKEKLTKIEEILIDFLNSKYLESVNISDSYYSFLVKYSDDLILNRISIIENEISKLDYNVNYKLWLDSLFSRLIGG